MKNLNVFKWLHSRFSEPTKVIRAEFATRIVEGDEMANREYNTCLSVDKAVSTIDENLKLLVIAQGSDQQSEDSRRTVNYITSRVKNWFTNNEQELALNDSILHYSLSELVKGIKKEIRSFNGNLNSVFSFAISDGEGNALIYNIGNLACYIRQEGNDKVFDITAGDPSSYPGMSLDNNNGSFFHYKKVDEIYLVTRHISEYEIDESIRRNEPVKSRVITLASSRDYDREQLDTGCAVLVKKR